MRLIQERHDKLNRGDWRGATEPFAVDARNFGRPVGREGILRVTQDVYTTFPDWKMEIIEMIAVDDSVVARCRVSGTHRGVGHTRANGGLLFGVEPTGRPFTVEHIHWYKFREGQIVDHYATRDDLGMLKQLGLVPSEPPS
jgi:predicted ester cyclase